MYLNMLINSFSYVQIKWLYIFAIGKIIHTFNFRTKCFGDKHVLSIKWSKQQTFEEKKNYGLWKFISCRWFLSKYKPAYFLSNTTFGNKKKEIGICLEWRDAFQSLALFHTHTHTHKQNLLIIVVLYMRESKCHFLQMFTFHRGQIWKKGDASSFSITLSPFECSVTHFN